MAKEREISIKAFQVDGPYEGKDMMDDLGWREQCFRVLSPGGKVIAVCGSRTDANKIKTALNS